MRCRPLRSLLALSLLAMVTAAFTQTPALPHAHGRGPAMPVATIDVPSATKAPVAVVERFGKALAAGDFKQVESLLAADVVILESGGAERSRSEYLGHHAIADAQFLKGAHSALTRRLARADGELAWVASESELHASKDGKPLTLLSTETMVLKKTGADWRIVHIHWSSRPKR